MLTNQPQEPLGISFKYIHFYLYIWLRLPRWLSGKEITCQCRRHFPSLSREDPLEEEMVSRPSILAWEIPWTEEPGGLYSPWGYRKLDMT